ncbi:hypothetical protein CHELA40_14763 [Chelatococcus asaccharovorans]|nr:hypothetical protein CHELA17_60858 [Chelatococcus asaccharovorans]CAH1679807.1 hypothetical protein CHELA40_14763 [Chelatococcus asaccharovorans]
MVPSPQQTNLLVYTNAEQIRLGLSHLLRATAQDFTTFHWLSGGPILHAPCAADGLATVRAGASGDDQGNYGCARPEWSQHALHAHACRASRAGRRRSSGSCQGERGQSA